MYPKSVLAPAAPEPIAVARKICFERSRSGVGCTLDGTRQVAGLVVSFEVDDLRIRVVGGVVVVNPVNGGMLSNLLFDFFLF